MMPSSQPAGEAGTGGSAPPPPEPGRPGGHGHRRPRVFDIAVAGLVVALDAAVVLGGFMLHQVLYYRLEMNSDAALGITIAASAVVLLFGGFLAARIGRKLCVLESSVSGALVFGALLLVLLVVLPVMRAMPEILQGVPAAHLVGGVAAVGFGVGFFRFLGTTIGYLLGGGGGLDLNFSYERYIARRHLLAKKRTTFISVITVISVCAVAVGVWALVVVLSVMSGFEEDLKGKILGTNAHAVVLKYATPFDQYKEVEKKVRKVKGITGVSPFVIGTVMVGTGTQTDGVVLKGIVPKTVGQVTYLPKKVTAGKLSFVSHPAGIVAWAKAHAPLDMGAQAPPVGPETGADGGTPAAAPKGETAADEKGAGTEARAPPAKVLPGIAIGRELARSLRVFVGDTVNVISPVTQDLGPTGPVPRSKTFRVGAIFYTGMYEYDSKFAYINLPVAQDFFDMNGSVTGLEVRTSDIDETRAIMHRVMVRLEGYPYYTKDFSEMNKNLFSALKLEKLVMAVILAFIVLVASFVILATLIMMIMEKGKEIAILKSMGVRDASIMKVFVLEGLTVGLIGTAVGLVLGLGSCALISSGIISLDQQVYYISTLPVRIEPLQIVLTCVIAIVLSYLATIYPSVTASRLHPVEGLRDE